MGTVLTLEFVEERDPPPERRREVLARPEEFGVPEDWPVVLTCSETEWSLGAFRSGHTIWLNQLYTSGHPGEPRHMVAVPPERVLALWDLLAAGRIDEIEQEPWQPGPGRPA